MWVSFSVSDSRSLLLSCSPRFEIDLPTFLQHDVYISPMTLIARLLSRCESTSKERNDRAIVIEWCSSMEKCGEMSLRPLQIPDHLS